ncbi:MAG: rhodanese-like domain-containing protein [Cyclobacteriaceae bacterium]|nr:rhodanese-like domain-containing protein [Cyclobacteriaceae bacterium]
MKQIFYVVMVLSGLTFSCQGQNGKSAPSEAAGTSAVSPQPSAEVAGPVLLAPDAFENKFKSTENHVLLDVRTPNEVGQGYIEGAINIDTRDGAFREKIAGLEKDKTYFVYCHSGGRSRSTFNLMKGLGFSVYELQGGITAWRSAGKALVK